jgi:hypothetical protein
MVPTLKVPKDALKENGFINAYVEDSDVEEQHKDSIYLLFKPENLDKFREFLENEYERTKSIIEDYDYDDGYVVVVYQLDKKHKKDFSLVRKGEYSKTSKEFQALFPKVIKIVKDGLHRDELSLQYRIFVKSNDLVEYWEEKIGIGFSSNLEVWEGFDIENEILNINKIKEYAEQRDI